MTEIDWTNFKRKIYINAPMQEVYNAWATAEGLEDWFLEDAAYFNGETERGSTDQAQVGDRYTFDWYHWEHIGKGAVLAANGTDHFAFSFEQMRVDIELKEEKGKTLCTLIQKEVPIDEESKMFKFYGCSTGWTFFMANLKAFLEHGINLIDKEEGLYGKHDGMDYVNN